jgi:predicted O-methyltransferase YrrM
MLVFLKKTLNKLPYVRSLHLKLMAYNKSMQFPPGHFYSPIVSKDEAQKNENNIWKSVLPKDIVGIDFCETKQLELLTLLSHYYAELPFQEQESNGLRYYFENKFYSYTDGIILYAMLRHLKPERVIEIGSGFSSALMLDVNEHFLEYKTELTIVEPFPKRLNSLLTELDAKQTNIVESLVQEVDLNIFKRLEKDDILFIDSSHIVKTGSDLHHIFFNILPIINSGVYIHFHDVFYPFEYPKTWVLNGFNWNEDYFLRAFLMYNSDFEIVLFSDYLHKFHKTAFKSMPMSYNNTGGNLWLVKK